MYEQGDRSSMHHDFDEIYDFYSLPYWQTTWFKLVIICGSILIIGAFVYWFMRRQKTKVTYWQLALNRLQELSVEACENKHDFKKVYFDMTLIIKTYLEDRYQWKLLDKTDDELITYLQKKRFQPELLETMKKLFLGANLIKYADVSALKTQVEDDVASALSLVKKTIPAE